MSTKPLVSVLIPLFNAAPYLPETLKYVLSQTYTNVEVIMVDDGSTDNSWDIASRYTEDSRVRLLRNPNKGACSARNYAFSKSKGKYVMFMDADDYCSLDKIERQVQALDKGPIGSVAYCSLANLRDGQLELPGSRKIDRDYDSPIDLLLDMLSHKGGFNCPHCYLVPRDLVEKVGGWDESVRKNQDGEFFSRIIMAASKMLYVPEVYAVWRHTGSGISATATESSAESQLYTYRKIAQMLLEHEDSARVRKAISWQIGWHIYLNYPHHPVAVKSAMQFLQESGFPLWIDNRGKLYGLLRRFIGWRAATRVVKSSRVIQMCSAIRRFLGHKTNA